jgi:DNA-binding MarR family transcriptional regulator
MADDFEEEILRSLRRVTRAIDLHSRWLATTFGLTGPQLVCLRVIVERRSISPGQLAREVALSQATITGIVDRLAARQLVTRARDAPDRRLVSVSATDAGRALVSEAPSPLQDRFVQRLRSLSEEDRNAMRETLRKIVEMMDGEAIDAAPVLSSGGDVVAPEQVAEGDSQGGRGRSNPPS